MTYTFTRYSKGNKVVFQGDWQHLKDYLVAFCKNHRIANRFYISRDIDNITDESGNVYVAEIRFDKKELLKSYRLVKQGKQTDWSSLIITPQYSLSRYIPSQNRITTDYFNSREECIRYIKACAGYQFQLRKGKSQQTFDVQYVPERGLIVNNKTYKA